MRLRAVHVLLAQRCLCLFSKAFSPLHLVVTQSIACQPLCGIKALLAEAFYRILLQVEGCNVRRRFFCTCHDLNLQSGGFELVVRSRVALSGNGKAAEHRIPVVRVELNAKAKKKKVLGGCIGSRTWRRSKSATPPAPPKTCFRRSGSEPVRERRRARELCRRRMCVARVTRQHRRSWSASTVQVGLQKRPQDIGSRHRVCRHSGCPPAGQTLQPVQEQAVREVGHAMQSRAQGLRHSEQRCSADPGKANKETRFSRTVVLRASACGSGRRSIISAKKKKQCTVTTCTSRNMMRSAMPSTPRRRASSRSRNLRFA